MHISEPRIEACREVIGGIAGMSREAQGQERISIRDFGGQRTPLLTKAVARLGRKFTLREVCREVSIERVGQIAQRTVQARIGEKGLHEAV